MRFIAAILFAFCVACSTGPARAADLSGIWTLDHVAWERELQRVMAAMLARIRPEVAANMRAAGVDPAAALTEAASAGLDSNIAFLPGGVLRTNSIAHGPSDDGRWTLAGDRLRIEVDDAEGLEAMVGEVDGDRITLYPLIPGNDPDSAIMRDMAYPLVRQR